MTMVLGVVAAAGLIAAAPAGAASVDDVEVIASGLDNPRHLVRLAHR